MAAQKGSMMRVAVLQTSAQHDKAENLRVAHDLIDRAAAAGADLVSLTEVYDYSGDRRAPDAPSVEPVPGPTSDLLAAKARQHGIWILGGSTREKIDGEDVRSYNTSVLFNRSGELVAKYRKIHLFDVEIAGHVNAKESATVAPGEEVVTADIEGHIAGLTICYDLRFPELYRLLALQGAEILFVPSQFTLFTGKDHWEVLLRARAIENQCFVIAAGQSGKIERSGAGRYGRSMIVDPWGTVLATAPDGIGIAMADIDFEQLRRVRRELPSLANRRPDVYDLKALAREQVPAD